MADANGVTGVGRRFVAMLIDGVLVSAWVFVGALLRLTSLSSWIEASMYAFSWTLATEGILVGMTGGTIGKHVMGIRIVRTDGSHVGFARAFARWFGKVPSAILLIGYAMALTDSQRRTLHDRIAGTCVMRKSGTPLHVAFRGYHDLRAAIATVALAALVVGATTGCLIAWLAPFTDGYSVQQHIFRMALAALPGVVGGLVLRNTRMALTGLVGGALAGAIAVLLFRGLTVLIPSDFPRDFIVQVFIITDIAVAISIGLSLRSATLMKWGAALGCLTYLRIPIVSFVARIFPLDPQPDPNVLFWAGYWALDSLLFWLGLSFGFGLWRREVSPQREEVAAGA
jgi:uncharacterized RDD family membrane protein YckC